MALHQSPNIVTNGLVFAYDMSNTKKSFKGAPVTNSFNCPNPYDSNNNVSFIINGTGTFQRVYSGTYGGYTITPEDVVYRYNLGDGGCHYHGNSAAISAGQYVCYSVDYYVSPDASDYPTNTSLIVLENYGGSALSGGTGVSSDVTTKGKWQTIQGYSGPTGGSGTQAMFLYPGGCGGAGSYIASRGFILMKNPMFEFRSDVRYNPFVNGTRSNTQAIFDLTNNNTITANSLTYASDGTFSFDGSSNNLSIGSFSGYSTNITCEAWFKTTSGATWKNIVCGPGGDVIFTVNGALLNFGTQNNSPIPHANYSTTTVNTGAWFHGVATYDGSNVRIYINGNLESTNARTGSITSGAKNIGSNSGGSSEYFNGTIATVRVYNRALTANEVAQNFAAQRGMYGI